MANRELTDKVALITGANNPEGIGAAAAKVLSMEGADVFINYLRLSPQKWGISEDEASLANKPGEALYHALRMEPPDEVLKFIQEHDGKASEWEADLNDAANIPLLFDKVESELGPVDILVNNAAHYCNADSIEELTPQTIDETYSINVRATLLLISEFVSRHKKLNKNWGRIINLSTGPAQAFTSQITYGTSKAAIEAATRAIAREVGPLGITINCVAPGPTQTGYISEKTEENSISQIPLRRLGYPNDIANAIVFLASDKAGWMTGQVLRVTGGLDM